MESRSSRGVVNRWVIPLFAAAHGWVAVSKGLGVSRFNAWQAQAFMHIKRVVLIAQENGSKFADTP